MRGLKKAPKVFRQGTLKGVELENVPRPQISAILKFTGTLTSKTTNFRPIDFWDFSQV